MVAIRGIADIGRVGALNGSVVNDPGSRWGRELPRSPRTEPYGPNSGIRLPPWVPDCKARIWPGVKDSRFWEPVIGQPRGPFLGRPILLTSPPQRASP